MMGWSGTRRTPRLMVIVSPAGGLVGMATSVLHVRGRAHAPEPLLGGLLLRQPRPGDLRPQRAHPAEGGRAPPRLDGGAGRFPGALAARGLLPRRLPEPAGGAGHPLPARGGPPLLQG